MAIREARQGASKRFWVVPRCALIGPGEVGFKKSYGDSATHTHHTHKPKHTHVLCRHRHMGLASGWLQHLRPLFLLASSSSPTALLGAPPAPPVLALGCCCLLRTHLLNRKSRVQAQGMQTVSSCPSLERCPQATKLYNQQKAKVRVGRGVQMR